MIDPFWSNPQQKFVAATDSVTLVACGSVQARL